MAAALAQVKDEVQRSPLSSAAKLDLLTTIAEKQQQAETALNLALHLTLDTNVTEVENIGASRKQDAVTTVSPGQEFMIAVTFHNGSKQALLIDHIKLEVPEGWNTLSGKTKPETVKAGEDLHANFRLRVPKDTAYTRPYWIIPTLRASIISMMKNMRRFPSRLRRCGRGWSIRWAERAGRERATGSRPRS